MDHRVALDAPTEIRKTDEPVTTEPIDPSQDVRRRWLLDSDPSLRWQVLRDLDRAPSHEVTAERARVATEGFGARLLATQAEDGRWGGAAWNRAGTSTMHVLTILREMGLDPGCEAAKNAVERVRTQVTWAGCGPVECDDHRFFEGETEPCINAQVAASGAYFGVNVAPLIERLLGDQRDDGGWNCDAHSKCSSFNTTICVLEALLEFECANPSSASNEARRRGTEYLLARNLCRRRSTGARIERDRKSGADWSKLAFPTWWHYDLLRALDFLCAAGVRDERADEAVAIVASKRDGDGRWPLQVRYPGESPESAHEGEASRWMTVRALRVMRWFEAT